MKYDQNHLESVRLVTLPAFYLQVTCYSFSSYQWLQLWLQLVEHATINTIGKMLAVDRYWALHVVGLDTANSILV